MCGVVYEVVFIYDKVVNFKEFILIEINEAVIDVFFVGIEIDKVFYYAVCILDNVIIVLSL